MRIYCPGIKLSKSGINYFGLDLPAVIDAMKPAVREVIGDSDFSLINMSDQVKEIIETTGFDTIFC